MRIDTIEWRQSLDCCPCKNVLHAPDDRRGRDVELVGEIVQPWVVDGERADRLPAIGIALVVSS